MFMQKHSGFVSLCWLIAAVGGVMCIAAYAMGVIPVR